MTALASLPPTLRNVKRSSLPLRQAPFSSQRRGVSASPVPCCPRGAPAPCPCFPPGGAGGPLCWGRSLPGLVLADCVSAVDPECVRAGCAPTFSDDLGRPLKFGSRQWSYRLTVVFGHVPADALLCRVWGRQSLRDPNLPWLGCLHSFLCPARSPGEKCCPVTCLLGGRQGHRASWLWAWGTLRFGECWKPGNPST